jgi:hypothetical protein
MIFSLAQQWFVIVYKRFQEFREEIKFPYCKNTLKFRVILMTEAVHASETSVNFNVTIWRYIQEDSKLHTHRCEKSLRRPV